MRNAFIDGLVAEAEINDKIALVVGDLGYSVVEPFAEKFPDRFINAGVAEQNMMGLAAGMASEGYHVFTYSIANFPTFRCAEQIRNDVAYHNLPVSVVAVGGGLGYGNLGYSHHAIQDYGLIRMLPNMLIAAPGDPFETRACIEYLSKNPGPSYLRLGKSGEKNFHKEVPSIFPGGTLAIDSKSRTESKKNLILTTGAVLEFAEKISQSELFLEYSIKSLPMWGMSAEIGSIKDIFEYERIIVVEDHLIECGFGSWILEIVNRNNYKSEIILLGLESNISGLVGSQKTLNTLGGLNLETLVRKLN